MRVHVYWNIHKKCWSVRHKGKVIQYRKRVALADCTFHVQPAGRARVLREKRKNVHAYICGTLVDDDVDATHNSMRGLHKRIVYDPYLYASFMVQHPRALYGGEGQSRLSPIKNYGSRRWQRVHFHTDRKVSGDLNTWHGSE
jgi:hypothetical protein